MTTAQHLGSVAFLLAGYLDDEGWNSTILGASKRAEALGFEVSCVQGVDSHSANKLVDHYSDKGVDLLVAHGYQFCDAVLSAAERYPDARYLVTDRPPLGRGIPRNVAFLTQRQDEGAYLCGRLAAWLTETGVVAFVGGPEIPTQEANADAYRRGVASLNRSVMVLSGFAGSFGARAVGERTAERQFDAGADVVLHTADSAGLGVFDACRRLRRRAIGYVVDQSRLAPGLVATSLIVDVPFAVAVKLEEVINRSFSGGEWTVGLVEGVVSLAPFAPFVSDEAQADIRLTRAAIIDGRVAV